MTTPGPVSVGGGAAAHRRRPSINDVARLAGVSHQTVSRFLNGHPLVSDPTRQRITAAISELDYRPNRSARTLVTGQTHLLGVVISGRTHSGPSAMTQSIEDAARERGYALVIRSLPEPRQALVHAAGEQLLDFGIDGIIILASAVPDALVRGNPWPVPVVVVQGHASPGVQTIELDGSHGAALAVQHLLGLGHQQVWHVAGPAGWQESQQRLDGWRTELRNASITPPPVIVGDWTAASGYRAGRVLSQDPTVTAVFAANDEMAAGVQAAYRDAGRGGPDHFSIVGFDDHPIAAYLHPPLSTVRADINRLGDQVLTLLTQAPQSKILEPPTDTDPTLSMDVQLVLRDSTASPPPDQRATHP